MNLIESSPYIKYLMVASNNWRKLYTVILRKYYVAMSLYRFVLRFLINTYEGLSFQKLFKTGSCDSPKHEVLDIYIWRNLTQVYSFFDKHTYGKTDNASFFISNKAIFKLQATVQKCEVKIFNRVNLSTIT